MYVFETISGKKTHVGKIWESFSHSLKFSFQFSLCQIYYMYIYISLSVNMYTYVAVKNTVGIMVMS